MSLERIEVSRKPEMGYDPHGPSLAADKAEEKLVFRHNCKYDLERQNHRDCGPVCLDPLPGCGSVVFRESRE